MCVSNYSQVVCTNLSFLCGCLSVCHMCRRIWVCLQALVCRCPTVVSLPVKRTFQVKKMFRAMTYSPQGLMLSVSGRYAISIVQTSAVNMHACMFFVTITVWICRLQTWSWRMSYTAAAWLTDSFRTTTWGPMVCLSGRLTGEWHQWEPAVPPPWSQALSDSQ